MAENEEVTLNEPSNEAPLDDSTEQSTVVEDTATPPAPAPSIDFAALYRESLAERRRAEERIAALEAARNTQPEEEITDADIEKYGTTGTIQKIVANTLQKHLSEQFGPITEMSREYKRNREIVEAENQFFQQFPQLATVREGLSGIVRQAIATSPRVDADTYTKTALSAVGLHFINQQTAQSSLPVPNSAPARPSAPAPRNGAAPTSAPTRRLSELERNAIRQYGLDPNKRDDVDKFFAIVENDEGVTVA